MVKTLEDSKLHFVFEFKFHNYYETDDYFEVAFMGKGLLRLFFALWLVWIVIGVGDTYKELATYAGYDGWTVEKALERNEIKYGAECEANPSSSSCIWLSSVAVDEIVNEAGVKRKVSGFVDMALIVPLIFLLFFTFIFMLGKWVVRGFKK